MAKRKDKKFKYKRRGKESVDKRQKQTAGNFDPVFRSDIEIFTAQEGKNRLRILPPTWDDAEHWGLDVWMHSNVGSNNETYICVNSLRGERCAVCDEYSRLTRSGDDKAAAELKAYKRVCCYVIDRDKPEEGVKLFQMPWTIDRDLATRCTDEDGEILYLDDPEEGYDISFTRTGKGLKTKYEGIAVARKATPLARDEEQAAEWLEFVTENPILDILVTFDFEHIEAKLLGAAESEDNEDDDDGDEEDAPRTRRSRKSSADEDEDAPFDDDDDDIDGGDDEPKKKKKKKKKK